MRAACAGLLPGGYGAPLAARPQLPAGLEGRGAAQRAATRDAEERVRAAEARAEALTAELTAFCNMEHQDVHVLLAHEAPGVLGGAIDVQRHTVAFSDFFTTTPEALLDAALLTGLEGPAQGLSLV